MVNDSLRGIVDLCADVDEVLLFRRKAWGKLKNLPDFLRFLRELGRQDWDYVLDFQGLFRSGLCAYAAGRRRNTYGFAQARELAPRFYGYRIDLPDDCMHAVEKNLRLVQEALGVSAGYSPPRFQRPPETVAAVDRLWADHQIASPALAIAPMSRWPSKTWPPEFFAQTVERVAGARPDLSFWLLGTAAERPVGEAIQAAVNSSVRVPSLMGETDLPALLESLRRSQVLLTNDSGPMHIAAALETPVVALFGPTSPAKTGPYGPQHAVLQTAVECAPCLKRNCPLPRQLCRDDVISPQLAADAILERI